MVSVADTVHIVTGRTYVINRVRLHELDGAKDRGEGAKVTDVNWGESEAFTGYIPLK